MICHQPDIESNVLRGFKNILIDFLQDKLFFMGTILNDPGIIDQSISK